VYPSVCIILVAKIQFSMMIRMEPELLCDSFTSRGCGITGFHYSGCGSYVIKCSLGNMIHCFTGVIAYVPFAFFSFMNKYTDVGQVP
jgi:hypothetical protein